MPDISNVPNRAAQQRKGKGKAATQVARRPDKKTKKISEKQAIEALERSVASCESTPDKKMFSDMPISEQTKRGLKKSFFTTMTPIQHLSLPDSLKGKDLLGAAQTGSGKTLAFLVPVLEVLYRKKWGPSDGLGALVVSPTRELAVQIFEVLKSIGGFHSFSAGLIIGGKDLKSEKDRLTRMNILVATPGRLLQHMDQTVGFEAGNLQVLVLDEADRILDMGFSKTLSALLSHLPKSRQTLLFSATQTQSVADLARLSLKDPVHIGVDEHLLPLASTSKEATDNDSADQPTPSFIPPTLSQHYILAPLPTKLSTLFSFIKTHLHSKTLVFLSSCKQVRFTHTAFSRMQPGIPLLALHGKLKQATRLATYQKFARMKSAVLFATDIAARGLDFAGVEWVVQVDAPEDVEGYVHRVGRTARYGKEGKALLFLDPSEEEGMVGRLKKRGIEVAKIKVREGGKRDLQQSMMKLCWEDPEVKYLAQRAFISYLRSIHLQKDKEVFKVQELDIDKFAEALGLPGTPKVKFLTREMAAKKKAEKNKNRDVAKRIAAEEDNDDDEDLRPSGSRGRGPQAEESDEGGDSSEDEEGGSSEEDDDNDDQAPAPAPPSEPTKAVRTKYDRMFERKNQKIEHYTKLIDDSDADSDDSDDFITLKRSNHDLPDADGNTNPQSTSQGKDMQAAPSNSTASSSQPSYITENLSKRQQKLSKSKKQIIQLSSLSKRLTFDDEGNPHELYELADGEEYIKERGGVNAVIADGKEFAQEGRQDMGVADVRDRAEAREKKREKKRKRKEREDEVNNAPARATLADEDESDDGYVSPEFDLPSMDEEEVDKLWPPAAKRGKFSHPHDDTDSDSDDGSSPGGMELDDTEAMALRLLNR